MIGNKFFGLGKKLIPPSLSNPTWDVGDESSYPSPYNGGTLYNIGPLGQPNQSDPDYYDGLLNNVGTGITYDSANGGSLKFTAASGGHITAFEYMNSLAGRMRATSPCSYEVIFKTPASPSSDVIFRQYTNNGSAFFCALVAYSPDPTYGTIAFGSTITTRWQKMKITTPLSANTWYHVVITYNGAGSTNAANFKFYLNGVSQTILTHSGSVISYPNLFNIGWNGYGGYANFNLALFSYYLFFTFEDGGSYMSQDIVTQHYNYYKGRFGL